MKKRLLSFLAMLLLCVLANAQNPVPIVGAVSKRTPQSGNETTKAFDGNLTTMYHSNWSLNAMPDTIDFYFNGAKSINKIDYTPRQSQTNGIWTTVDVYYATADAPSVFVSKLTNITWTLTNTVKTIDMTASPIVKPGIVRFVIRAAGGNFSSCAEINFSSAETGTLPTSADCDNPTVEDFIGYADVKLPISSASVSPAANTGEDIARTYDNNTSTLYHSSYSGGGFPISLTYNFTGNPTVNYINYIPRQDGGQNGLFGTGEIWYKTTTNTTLTKLMDFNNGFGSSLYQINFPSALTNVTQIVVKVLTGRNNYASCAEMQFYQQSSGGNLYTNIFANDLHSTLKPGVIQADIDGITSPFFKSLAQCIFNNTYNYKYRVQTYDFYPNPGTVEGILKSNGLNRVENPTGIAFKENTKAIVFVGDTYGVNPNLVVKDFILNDHATVDTYPLQKGINIINIAHNGQGYIGYFSNRTDLQPVQVNIATGGVNGYYDPLTDTDEEWTKMLLNDVYPKLDIKGTYINLNFDKSALFANSHASGKALIAAYDAIVHIEYTQNGLFKYNRVPKNHMFVRSADDGGGWYAGGDGVHLDLGWGGIAAASSVNANWGIAHELGHNNQVRPGAKWVGTTEVTNNINSAWVVYTSGGGSRIDDAGDSPKAGVPGLTGGLFGSLFNNSLVQKKHIQDQGNVFMTLVPFWQLELYYQLGGGGKNLPTLLQRENGTPAPAGQPDVAYWYADVLERMRTTSQSGLSNGQLVLNFIDATCDAVHEDLTDFFVKSGFLLPIDKDIDDYGVQHITITQAMIDTFIASIQAKGYSKPASPVLNYISLNSLNTYKNFTPMTGATGVGVTVNSGTLTIDHAKWTNVVAFETYNQKVLTDVAIYGAGYPTLANTKTTVQYGTGSTSVYAVGVDGSRKLVYPAVDVVNSLPTVSITSPVSNSVVTAGSDVSINANAADTDGTITKVEFYQGSTLLGQSSTAPYSFIWTNPAVGNYNLTAKATDNNGGVKVSDTVKVIINTLPTVAISSPANNTVFTAGTNVTIDANAADTDGTITKVEFYQGSTLLGQSTTAPYSFTWTNPAVGAYALTAKATDNNGGTKISDTIKVTINTLPTVAISSPTNNAVYTAGANVVLNANAGDADGTISKVEFYQGSTLLGQSTTAPYGFTWNNPAAGAYALTAKATDNNGGTTTSAIVNVTVNALPTIAISSPANNTVYAAGANVTINASATDADGTVAKVEFYQGSTLLGQSTTAPYSFTWNNPSVGNYNLTAKATDNNGGTTTSAIVNVTVNTLPTIAISLPANNAVYATGANVTINASATDADGTVAKVEFYQGSTLLGQSGTAPYSFTWTNLPAGSYALTAKATDNNGGTTTSAIVNITVNTLPTIAISSPANNAVYTAGANVTINASATDADGTVAKVEFYQGSTLLGQSTTAPYSFTWNNPAVGAYALTAKATDNNGGTTTSAIVNVTVNTLPTVAISSPANNAVFTAGTDLTINANATDGDGTVAKVEFYQGSTLLGQSGTAPYSFTWTNLPAGNYALTAKATDNNGGTSTSTAVNVTVSAAPTVAITAPVNNAVFTSNSNITLNVNTTGTIVKVEFYQGSTLLGQSTTAPYNMVWNNVPSGTYTLSAKATDNLGRVATSSAVTVKVNAPQALAVNPVADAFVRDGAFANANNGTLSNLDVSNDNLSNFRESYLRFDYSTFSGSVVNSAKIRVYASRIDVNPLRTVSVYGLSNTTWGENSITWNNKPSENGTLLGSYTVKNTVRAWYVLDVTAYINSQLALGKKIVSFKLINEGAKGFGNLVSFNSREATSNKPELLLNQEASAMSSEELPLNTNNGNALGSLLALKVTAWPNPSTTGFKVQVESPSNEALQYRVYNVAQQLVKEAKTAVTEQLTFGAELPTGVYVVEVRQGAERKVVKVIKL